METPHDHRDLMGTVKVTERSMLQLSAQSVDDADAIDSLYLLGYVLL